MKKNPTAPARIEGLYVSHSENMDVYGGERHLAILERRTDGSAILVADIETTPDAEKYANVMAAAPELLKACQALYQVLCDTDIGQTPDDELDERQLEALRLYESATARAEGSPSAA